MPNLTQDRVLCYTNGLLETVPDNRNYKDSVFVDLFSTDEKAKERFLSLYNALHGTELKDTKQLKNVRLDQVLYMSFYNDVSYLVENKIIVLAEHPRARMYIRIHSCAASLQGKLVAA